MTKEHTPRGNSLKEKNQECIDTMSSFRKQVEEDSFIPQGAIWKFLEMSAECRMAFGFSDSVAHLKEPEFIDGSFESRKIFSEIKAAIKRWKHENQFFGFDESENPHAHWGRLQQENNAEAQPNTEPVSDNTEEAQNGIVSKLKNLFAQLFSNASKTPSGSAPEEV